MKPLYYLEYGFGKERYSYEDMYQLAISNFRQSIIESDANPDWYEMSTVDVEDSDDSLLVKIKASIIPRLIKMKAFW